MPVRFEALDVDPTTTVWADAESDDYLTQPIAA